MELQDVGKRHKLAQIAISTIVFNERATYSVLVTATAEFFKVTLFRTQRWYLQICDGIFMSGENVFMVRLMSDALPVWG